ncbi:cytoplasmic dynein 1 intermediate chain isoform X8 [Drosophila sechellia]|uniref:Cytoplasmic dynein 1 intermediate chain isoform X4 n=1 Tax=Drosophila mauritiana TaxID=7226 RepID=A0A6P8L9L2_DROMA|nr:cytoplasmic dynein 1 intermediate chain isoform X8 [Drosophila sechellia]XP_033171776.1 cytoplasmic dynein 1 intermediate chain isoform X4 [Drosophila mauritiana]XP_039153534.1 cytoplasmic dynein 1 intermediate chain isoform X16 [Drosophila simulans]AAC78306.1 cytoplasmic dynein intermediate chain isoform [Drosophila melanogaster]
MDRKAELERKKAKLAALREEKDRRRREKEIKDMEEAAGRIGGGAGIDKDQRKDLDEMLSSLGVAPVSEVLSSLSSVNSMTSDNSNTQTPDASLQATVNGQSGGKKQPLNLSVYNVQATNIPPKETLVYTKQTQTTSTGGGNGDGYMEDWWRPRKAHATDYYDEYNLNPGLEWEDEFTVLAFDAQGDDEESSLQNLGNGFTSKLPPGYLTHGLPTVKDVAPAITPLEIKKETEVKKEVNELSEEQKQMIILSENFQRFVVRAGRVIERALSENVDIYTDYIGGGDSEEANDERSHARLSLNRVFYDERWSKNRCITSMDWSTHFPELVVGSYHNNEESPNEPDGVVMVWNTKFKKSTPEDVFHCQSAVMSTCFAKFNPNLILGGTYSGQIVLWDNRVQKRTPIQRTPLSAAAHTHPVYCLQMVGTQNAHNVISISSDGKLCSWSLDMLSQPQDTLELQQRQSKAIAITSMAFPANEINSLVMGSEDGYVYSASRHGLRSGVNEVYERHLGPITGISTHYNQLSPDFGHLFLTSSIDWTIKLWSLKDTKPLYSFEDNSDYVMDVAWSPVHPALFAAVDGSGRLDLWNLNQDTEVPTASIVVAGAPALNRVSWTPSGLHVCIGDEAGKLYVYDVAENLAQPSRDEWSRFNTHLSEIKMNQSDEV